MFHKYHSIAYRLRAHAVAFRGDGTNVHVISAYTALYDVHENRAEMRTQSVEFRLEDIIGATNRRSSAGHSRFLQQLRKILYALRCPRVLYGYYAVQTASNRLRL